MVRSFDDLADEVAAGWSDEVRRVFVAAARSFHAELDAQVRVGKMLSTARKARRFSQPVLSELANVQQAEISRIENGVGNPTITTLARLADALNVELTLEPRVSIAVSSALEGFRSCLHCCVDSFGHQRH